MSRQERSILNEDSNESLVSMRRISGRLVGLCCAIWSSLVVFKYVGGTSEWLKEGENGPAFEKFFTNYPELIASISGLACLTLFAKDIDRFRSDNNPLLAGLGEMARDPYSPRPTPRLDYDVATGLPNHRTTPERKAEIKRNLVLRAQEQAGDANNAPWCSAQAGCWDMVDAIQSSANVGSLERGLPKLGMPGTGRENPDLP